MAINPLRLIARPLLAAGFIADGVSAVTNPDEHAAKFQKVTPVIEKVGGPPVLAADARLLARISGAITVVAGIALAFGRAPRLAAATLAALNLPITLVNNPVWLARTAPDRKTQLRAIMQGAAVSGGLLLATVDRRGEPSWWWQAQNRLQNRREFKQLASQLAAKSA